MSAIFKLYTNVRVRALLQSESDYNGWNVNVRHPQIGDIGTIIYVLSQNRFVVENSSSDGITIWLGEFCEEELELI